MELRSLSSQMLRIEELVFGAVMGVTKDAVPSVQSVSLRLGKGAWDALHADVEARRRMHLVGEGYPRILTMETTTAAVTLEKDETLDRFGMAITLVV